MRLCFPQHSPYPPRASGYTQIHRAPEPEATEADTEAYDLGTLCEAFDVLHPGQPAPNLYLTHHPERWPGGMHHLTADQAASDDLLGQLAAQLQVPNHAPDLGRAICADLSKRRAVLLVEEHVVYAELGDARNLLVGKTNRAVSISMQWRYKDGPEIVRLPLEAYQAAVEMEIPEAEQIAGVMEQIFGRRPGPAAP
jgi:hypothetical protein